MRVQRAPPSIVRADRTRDGGSSGNVASRPETDDRPPAPAPVSLPADPAGHLQAHCRALASAGGLDAELARGWTVVREVRNALSYLAHGSTGEAQRSLWVASSVLGRTLDGLPPVDRMPVP